MNDMKLYSYEEIDALVEEYKSTVNSSGDEAKLALTEIVKAFDGYILKWVSILSGSNPNIQDPEVVAFISLFGCNDVYSVLDILRNCYHEWERDELYNEILLRFIEAINRYKRLGSTPFFAGYIKHIFKYKMYWMTITANGNRSGYVDISNMTDSELTAQPTYSDTPDPEVIYLLDNDHLPCLSDSERSILYMFAGRGMSYEAIADTLGVKRRTMVTRIGNIKSKLRKWLDKQSLGD